MNETLRYSVVSSACVIAKTYELEVAIRIARLFSCDIMDDEDGMKTIWEWLEHKYEENDE